MESSIATCKAAMRMTVSYAGNRHSDTGNTLSIRLSKLILRPKTGCDVPLSIKYCPWK